MSNPTPWMNQGRPSSRRTIFTSHWNQTSRPSRREHPVGRPERLAGQEHLGRLDAPAMLVLRVDVVVPADRILQPLRLGEPHDLLDPRAHVGLADAAIEVGHEDDRRHLLHQRAVLGFQVGQRRVGRRRASPAPGRRRGRTRRPGRGGSTSASRWSMAIGHLGPSPAAPRQLGSLFIEARVKRRSAWIARP